MVYVPHHCSAATELGIASVCCQKLPKLRDGTTDANQALCAGKDLSLRLSATGASELTQAREQFNQWLGTLQQQQHDTSTQTEQLQQLVIAIRHMAKNEQKHLGQQQQIVGETLTMVESMNQSVLDEVQSANMAADAANHSIILRNKVSKLYSAQCRISSNWHKIYSRHQPLLLSWNKTVIRLAQCLK